MRFLLSETWVYRIYGEPYFQRLQELGEVAHAFREELFFRPRQGMPWPLQGLSRTSCRLQERFHSGPRLDRLNSALLDSVGRLHPDVVVLFRGAHIFPETVAEIRRKGVLVAGYSNDDPFSSHYPSYVWRHFLASIPLFDHLFAYRHRNITDFVKCGARSVSLLRSFYLRDQNFPIPGAEKGADVSFIGHWENDGREASVSAILDLPEVRFRLWGTGWHLSPNATDLARKLGPIEPLRGSAYNLAINRSRISLVFLSSINHDTYTRRCFEIPAAGGFMLAPYTDDLASLFREGREAEYFRSRDEMLDKIRFYLSHEAQRSRIAEAGRERLLYEGHEALDRARQMRDDMRRLL